MEVCHINLGIGIQKNKMDKVVHFEIPAEDMKRAEDFYAKVFGWQIQEMPEMNYTIVRTAETDEKFMIKEPGAINGGMFKRTETLKSPILVINVHNIHEACEHVKMHGGHVIKESQAVGEMGHVAYFKDTEGNVVGLWQDNKR